MPHASHPLPSINLVGCQSDHYKTRLPNLGYPSRFPTHVPWSGSSVPLVVSKTESARYETGWVNCCRAANAGNSAGDGFHVSFETHILNRIKAFISHATSTLLRNLDALKEQIAVVHLFL